MKTIYALPLSKDFIVGWSILGKRGGMRLLKRDSHEIVIDMLEGERKHE